jgi:hypothetical protein
MTNKALRVLIADERLSQLLHLERLLNRLGYYRVAPIRTFDELASLTDHPGESFDLLIVNRNLPVPKGIDMSAFCRARPHILHALFYDTPDKSIELVLQRPDQTVQIRWTETPDATSRNVLLCIIDPPSRRVGLKSLPWFCATA